MSGGEGLTLPAAEASLAAVAGWLAAAGVEFERIEPLAGDVSSRTYFRIYARFASPPAGPTRIVARYPPALAAAQERFRRAAALLDGAGVQVPRLLENDPEAGFALLEDLGPRTLYEVAPSWAPLATELEASLSVAAAIARLSPDAVKALGSESLGEPLLRRELTQTIELFLAPRGLASSALVAALGELCARLGALPQLPCHRDFMARNLVPDGRGGVAVLDFQDLRLGPPAYDLASLLNDSLFAAPELEERIVGERLERIGGWESYRRAVAQRCLKAVGTFVKFASAGGTRHLRLVQPTLARALDQLVRLPETSAIVIPLAPSLAAAGATVAAGGWSRGDPARSGLLD